VGHAPGIDVKDATCVPWKWWEVEKKKRGFIAEKGRRGFTAENAEDAEIKTESRQDYRMIQDQKIGSSSCLIL
jgi:hypothetical protein